MIVLLWLALLQSPDPHLRAQWDTAISATITWDGDACLWRQPSTGAAVFVGCGAGGVTLGGPLTDAAYRPAAGDVYCIGANECAPLMGRNVYLSVWRG